MSGFDPKRTLRRAETPKAIPLKIVTGFKLAKATAWVPRYKIFLFGLMLIPHLRITICHLGFDFTPEHVE